MQLDLELYRREVTVVERPLTRLSAIDLAPDAAHKTVLFLHGFGGQATQWRYQLRHFAFAHRVVALDLRGHGRSDRPAGRYLLEEIVGDVAAAVERLRLPNQLILVGHSFGGAIATEYALVHPDRVEHLVLMATAGQFQLNWPSRTFFRLPSALLRLLEGQTRNFLHAPLAVLKPWHQNTLSRWNGWERFPHLTVPTTVIRGHLDLLFARPQFEEVAQAIPSAEDVDVGASGHLVMLERRDAVNRALVRVVEGSSTQSWRDQEPSGGGSARTALLHERPWLAQYPPNVPPSVAIPEAPVHALLQSAVRRFPRQVAVQVGEWRLTYQQLDEQSNRFANALRTLGVKPGERVMLLLPDSAQFIIAFFGASKAGAVTVLTPPQSEPDELVAQVRATTPAVLVTVYEQSELAILLRNEQGGMHLIFTHREELQQAAPTHLRGEHQAVGTHQFSALLHGQSPLPPQVDVAAADLALIQYTSGTTGTAKGVMLTHRNLVANTLQTRHWIPDAVEGKERFLCVLSFSHIYGLTATLNLPIALGATLILAPGFDMVEILGAIRRHRPTVFPGVPGLYIAINNVPGVRRYGIDSIKYCISGSAPLPVEVQEEFEKLTKGRLVEGYGLTEAAPVTHANPLDGRRKVGSIGVPLPSTEARILDLVDGQREAPSGQIGELAVRGPQVMAGYWQQPDESAAVLRPDGWLLTGDVAQMDSEGFCRIIARKADMWYPQRPGEPAFPRDVEEVLYEVPQVREVAVVAIADQPVAFVTTQGPPPAAEMLVAYCQRRPPPTLVPQRIVFVEEFPRSFIGKVLRKELVKRYRDGGME
jgi:long-chain acyl-CoA synthetase